MSDMAQGSAQDDTHQTMNLSTKDNKRKVSQGSEDASGYKHGEKHAKISQKQDLYAKKANPRITPFGLIDGRSNAQAAFDQKIHLLQEFKTEFGHLNVPQNPPKKYYKLVDFVTKVRKFYRAFKDGRKRSSMCITEERIQVLNDIGFDWGLTPVQRWKEMFNQLEAFKKKWGHTCLGAFKDTDNNLEELKRWSLNQRRILRKLKSKNKHKDELEQNNESIELSEGEDGNTDKTSQCTPRYFTEEMASKLRGLECDFMNSSEYEHDNTCNTHHWYGRLEEYRTLAKLNRNGLMDVIWPQRLAFWIRSQQKIFKSVKSKKIDSNSIIERNISLLKSVGFQFDKETIEKQEIRQRELRYSAKTKEKADRRSIEDLVVAKKRSCVLEEKMSLLINKQVKIWEDLQETKLELFHANNEFDDALKGVAEDWIGRLVRIKSRGKNKAEGLGIVRDTRKINVGGGSEMALTMFDIDFVNDGRQEENIDEIFITTNLQGVESDVVGCEVFVLPRRNQPREGLANALNVIASSGSNSNQTNSLAKFDVKYMDGKVEVDIPAKFIRSSKYVNLS